MRTLQEQLKEKGLSEARRETKSAADTKTSKRSEERLTRRDIEELMGMNAPTYKRGAGGVIRRKR